MKHALAHPCRDRRSPDRRCRPLAKREGLSGAWARCLRAYVHTDCWSGLRQRDGWQEQDELTAVVRGTERSVRSRCPSQASRVDAYKDTVLIVQKLNNWPRVTILCRTPDNARSTGQPGRADLVQNLRSSTICSRIGTRWNVTTNNSSSLCLSLAPASGMSGPFLTWRASEIRDQIGCPFHLVQFPWYVHVRWAVMAVGRFHVVREHSDC